MRKILLTMVMALLIVVGCNKQEAIPSGEGVVTLRLGVPGDMGSATKAGENYVNSAKGGITNVGENNLKWDVKIYYSNNQSPIYRETATGGASFTKDFQLVMGETYTLEATANFDNPDTFNSEREDYYTYIGTFTAQAAVTAELKRSMGKLRLVAEDYKVAMDQMNKEVKSVKVKYKGGAAQEAEVNIYRDDNTATTGIKTLFVDYLQGGPNNQAEMYPFEIIVYFDDAKTDYKTYKISQDIPIKTNCLTTVRGNLFTGTTNLNITVDEEFEDGNGEEYTIDGAIIKSANNAAEAEAIINTTEDNPRISLTLPAEANVINLGAGFTSTNTTESILYLNYTQTPTQITINQDGYNSSTTVAPGKSKGKLVVSVPAGTDVNNVTITAPNMTIELVGGTYTNVDAITAHNTLIVEKDVVVDVLNILGGNVYVCDGAEVKAIKMNGKTAEQLTNADVNKKPIYIFAEEGAVIPTLPKGDYDNSIAIVPVTDKEQWNIINALATADSYTLQANSIISSPIVIEKVFTLDLNGYTITNEKDLYNVYDSQQFMTVVCRGGNLTIKDGKGTGKIATKQEDTDRKTATILAVALTHYGEEKWASNTPASLTVEGGHLYGTEYGISGNGTRYNTNITIKGGVIESDNHAIYHPQDGNFTMIGGTLKGKAGIEIRGGGDYTISGGSIEATDAWEFEQYGGGPASKGGAVVVNIYDQERRDFNLNITNGTFTGAKTIYKHEQQYTTYRGKISINVTGGTFNGADFNGL